MSGELLLDNSAWARLDQPTIARERRGQIADFGILGARTDLRFDSVWLAQRGTL